MRILALKGMPLMLKKVFRLLHAKICFHLQEQELEADQEGQDMGRLPGSLQRLDLGGSLTKLQSEVSLRDCPCFHQSNFCTSNSACLLQIAFMKHIRRISLRYLHCQHLLPLFSRHTANLKLELKGQDCGSFCCTPVCLCSAHDCTFHNLNFAVAVDCSCI